MGCCTSKDVVEIDETMIRSSRRNLKSTSPDHCTEGDLEVLSTCTVLIGAGSPRKHINGNSNSNNNNNNISLDHGGTVTVGKIVTQGRRERAEGDEGQFMLLNLNHDNNWDHRESIVSWGYESTENLVEHNDNVAPLNSPIPEEDPPRRHKVSVCIDGTPIMDEDGNVILENSGEMNHNKESSVKNANFQERAEIEDVDVMTEALVGETLKVAVERLRKESLTNDNCVGYLSIPEEQDTVDGIVW